MIEQPIPARGDDSIHLMIFSMEELVPIILGFSIGIFLEQKLLFTFIGWGISKVYMKFRDSMPDGFVLHYIYERGLLTVKSSSFVNPFVNRYFP